MKTNPRVLESMRAERKELKDRYDLMVKNSPQAYDALNTINQYDRQIERVQAQLLAEGTDL